MTEQPISRREFFYRLSAVSASVALAPFISWIDAFAADKAALISKAIPSSGEKVPVIGMGTWLTFHVQEKAAMDARTEVLKTFFDLGGGMIDSSPMYGPAEEVVGYGLNKLGPQKGLFSATKIWTLSAAGGQQQYADSQRLWGLNTFDLFQVHNLVNWPAHLEFLKEKKAAGEVRYIGVTTSHGRRHREVIDLLKTQDIDFLQITYNIIDREVEDRILPLAKDRGVAVIANRPFQGGRLIDRAKRLKLPEWSGELGIKNWAEFLLKFIVSHPAVTCAIPATSRVDHMRENMGAAYGELPTAAQRKRMIEFITRNL